VRQANPLFHIALSVQKREKHRPISILSVFSKILETLIYNRLIFFLVESNVFIEAKNINQSIKRHSKSNFYLKFTGGLRGIHAIGLLFDLSKEYDVINQDVLLDKLNSYGMRGESNLWFKSYLSKQLQFV
jgi:hypothetical protein